MSKILVTGGAGFIASYLAEKLASNKENKVVIVDNLLTGDRKKIPTSPHDNIHFIKCDTNNYKDISAVFYANHFDYVFHYAALVGVQRTLQNPVMVLEDIRGIENILSLSKNTGVKRVFFSSSSEVYGEPVEFPQNEETTPLNSRLPYAIVKNVGEAYFKSYKEEYDLDYTIFRFFNTYGPKQSKDFVVSKFIAAALENKTINLNDVKLPKTSNNLIIEGAGGLFVPINDDDTIVDLIRKTNAEVILVARHYLGSINHTLLTAFALKQMNIPIVGIVFSGEENLESEKIKLKLSGLKKITHIPFLSTIDDNTISETLRKITITGL
jgi:UDP-glucose 4-epimerase